MHNGSDYGDALLRDSIPESDKSSGNDPQTFYILFANICSAFAYVRYELTFGFSFSGALVCLFFISTFMILTMAHDSIGTLPTEDLYGHIISVVRTFFTLCWYCNEELLSCL